MNRTTFELIGDRYLDTQFEEDYIEELEAELKGRNIVGLRRIVYEYIAASSLWWNFLWWEWGSLNEKDVKIEWIQNLVFFTSAGFLGYYFVGFKFCIFVVCILHLCTMLMGISLRAGTKLTKR